MSLNTVAKLSAKIDKDLIWRKKELIFLKASSESVSDNCYILRASFPMICAHYEGFLKCAATYYLTHISDKNIPLKKLKNVFVPYALNSEFTTCNGSKRITVRAGVTKKYNEILSSPLNVASPKSFIVTDSNPSPTVLTEILESLALNSTIFDTKHTFINDSLLKNRHAIVHGEYREVTCDEFKDILSTTLVILEDIKELIINAAINKEYLKSV